MTSNNSSEKIIDTIEILSDEAQEVFGKTPPRLIRSGNVIIAIILLAILCGMVVFKYPDSIQASLILFSENPPVHIVSKSTGKLDALFVSDSTIVTEDQLLGVIANTADYHHVLKLKNDMMKIGRNTWGIANLEKFPTGQNYKLGSIQNSYASFIRQLKELKSFEDFNTLQSRVESLELQLKNQLGQANGIENQLENQSRIVSLAKSQFLRDSILYITNVISKVDFEIAEQNLLQLVNSKQGLIASLSSIYSQISELEYQVVNLRAKNNESLKQLEDNAEQAFNNLSAGISDWESNFMLTSPIKGVVSFNQFWKNNQFVVSGDIVFSVIPQEASNIIGRLKIPISGSGKVNVGQKVLIRLENYPYTEFGVIRGTLRSLSLVPQYFENGLYYSAEVEFKKGLVTDFGLELPHGQELHGQAEIITSDMNLLTRILGPIKMRILENI